jgi:hypothetical protein
MILDKQLFFSKAQADLRNAATYLSTYSVDLEKVGLAVLDQLWLTIKTVAAFTTGTNIVINVISASAETLDADVVVEQVLGTFTTANSGLTINKILKQVRLNPSFASTGRFLGIQYVVTGNYDAGTMDAYLSMEPSKLQQAST